MLDTYIYNDHIQIPLLDGEQTTGLRHQVVEVVVSCLFTTVCIVWCTGGVMLLLC